MNKNRESLALKWGTLKAWDLKTKKTKALLDKYFKDGVSMSAALQKDTKRQKNVVLELIDAVNTDKIFLDWENKYVSKKKAKEYVLNYE